MVFAEAVTLDSEARETFVRAACSDDPALAEEALELLQHEARVGDAGTVRPAAEVFAALETAELRSLIGRDVGRYRLEAEIASGGMGRVFKARRTDGEVEQIVALKLMREELFNPALLERFSTERGILAALNHPGIAHLIDAGTDERGTPFVAMEYVDGMPLLEYCAQNRLSVRERIGLFRKILTAVAYAHRNLVVHRDLKPSNILITADGLPKLLDFGIAKQLDPGCEQTATAHRFFTPAFAAPEQLGDGSATVLCDVYGLGAVLYTLLTGTPPLELSGASAAEIERRIRMVPPSPMRAVVLERGESAARAIGDSQADKWAAEIGGDLEQIVQKALRKEPESRYVSADQFDEDLKRYLERRPILASGSGWLYRSRKFCERNALAVSFSLVFVIASALGVVQLLRQNAQIRVERDRAELALELLQNAFSSADPMRLGADDIRARVILTSAAREINVLEKRQPDLFRDLAYRIGQIQLNLGLTSDGLLLVQRANRLRPDVPNIGALLEVRGLIMADRLSDARELAETHRERLGVLPEFQVEQAHLLYRESRHRDAIARLDRLLSEPALLRDPVLRDRAYLYLVEAHRLDEHPKRALTVIDRHVIELGKRHGKQHPSVLIARLRRVELLSAIGDASLGERELVVIKPLLERSYDRQSAVLGEYHHTFGEFLMKQNRRQEALQHFRQALEADLVALGPDHANTLRNHLNVAIAIAYGLPDRSGAYPHFDRAIEGLEKIRGKAHSLVGFARLEAAKSHFWDSNPEAARRVLTPDNALAFFPAMTETNRREYLEALHYGFGVMACPPEQRRRPAGALGDETIARTLICRYDPDGRHRPKNDGA